MAKFKAPKSWPIPDVFHWYADVPVSDRAFFAKKYCSKVRSYNGQAIIPCSYPRSNRLIVCYDMDAGYFTYMSPSDITKLQVKRDSEEADFHWEPIMDSAYCDEAGDISNILFDE